MRLSKRSFRSRGRQSDLILNEITSFKTIYERTYGPIPSWVKHFYPCDEYRYSYQNGLMVDVAGDYNFKPPSLSSLDSIVFTADPVEDQYHIGVPDGIRVAVGSDGTAKDRFECFNNQDWIVIVGATGKGASNIEFTIGGGPGTDLLKIQPYYIAYERAGHGLPGGGEPAAFFHTPFHYAQLTRNVGQDYLIAWLYRNGALEHWIDGVMVEQSANRSLMVNSFGRTYGELVKLLYDSIEVMRPPARSRMGHTAHAAISTQVVSADPENDYDHFVFEGAPLEVQTPAAFGGVAGTGDISLNQHTQYNGILLGSWDKGAMPTDIAGLLSFLKTEWFAGRKRADYGF